MLLKHLGLDVLFLLPACDSGSRQTEGQVDEQSLACTMPQYFLHSQGIDLNKDIDNHYVGSRESSIMHAYLKQAAAAATCPTSWRLFQKDHPNEAAERMETSHFHAADDASCKPGLKRIERFELEVRSVEQ
jgi:hypothetical protein